MPHLLLLFPSTTYRAEAFLEAAQRLELEVTIGSEWDVAPTEQGSAKCVALDFRDHDGAARVAESLTKEHRIDAVIGVDDVTAEVAAVVAAALGLLHNPPPAVAAARNKYRMRELLRAQAVPVPRYALFSADLDPSALASQVPFPCVVKPTMLSASCGVIRADDRESFVRAYRRIAALLDRLGDKVLGGPARHILVEEFIEGPEVALEGLLINGDLQLLALFDKPDPLDGPFFEETLYVTPSRHPEKVRQALLARAAQATRALGLREGPVHGEFRVNDRGLWVIEMAARSIGGQCSRSLRFAGDMSLEELILRQHLRMEIPRPEREARASGVMMLPIPYAGTFQEVRGQEAARGVPGIEELTITAEPGEELVPLPEGTRYLGFLFARADSPEVVEGALRDAHRCLDVVITPGQGTALERDPRPSRVRVVSF